MSVSNSSNEPHNFEPSAGAEFNANEYLRKVQESYRLAETHIEQSETNSLGRVRLIKAGCFLIIFIAVIGFIGLAIIARRERQEQAVKQISNEKIIREMANKYDAIPNWRKDIEGRDNIFSAEVLGALSGNKRPVLLKSIYIKDVNRKEGKYVVKFYEFDADSPDMYFSLECSEVQGRTITENKFRDSEFAIVASINDVRKPTKEDIEAEDDKKDFIASGTCLEIIPID